MLAELARLRVRGVTPVELLRLIEEVPVPASLAAYAQLVLLGGLTRTARAAGQRIVQSATRGGEPDQLFATALVHTEPLRELPVRWQRSAPPGPTRLAHLLPLTLARLAGTARQPPLHQPVPAPPATRRGHGAPRLTRIRSDEQAELRAATLTERLLTSRLQRIAHDQASPAGLAIADSRLDRARAIGR